MVKASIRLNALGMVLNIFLIAANARTSSTSKHRCIWTRCKSNMKSNNAYMLDFTKPSSTPMASQHAVLMMSTLLNGATSADGLCQLMMLHLAYLKLMQVENLVFGK